ncbi:L-aspartate oxidase [Acidipropionibacterium jensenii]|uniref:L-aspartate oxidase n=1 Tax=Acidipropionibacterium jensenii TaxID=1749 RepID=A0A3Q9UKL2_9ACTN|nr:L-aspartate oxidase [Acidipropionibacterium jensenii]AZZ39626.1 L-aspartate oxidase [Acidipropionibacterium jensenii]
MTYPSGTQLFPGSPGSSASPASSSARASSASPAGAGAGRRCDVVVVGTGAAGLSTVLGLLASGLEVAVVTRAGLTDSSTDWAQGGLAAVWAAGDSTGAHRSDTLAAGAGLCGRQAVAELVDGAPGAVRRLIDLGARFDTDSLGRIDLHLEGGHHARRILHAGGDESGHEVERTLSSALDSALAASSAGERLQMLSGTRLIDVLTDSQGRACGVSVLEADGGTARIGARAVVLATGGIGQLWPTTTNPPVATGDGLAAALRAGAVCRDAEFMQFHPTILVVPPDCRTPGDRGVLISEAVRGEGAFLVDGNGCRVMTGVHPLADLAPRDVVSAAEQMRMIATGEDHLFLDATGFGSGRWERSFPSILQMCRERGVDPVLEPIPVRPGAHYHCGGVVATMTGLTCVPGLRAVGEVACTGVQGANRLASNSLTEALVMGERTAADLAGWLSSAPAAGPAVERAAARLVDHREIDPIRAVMERDVSVMRDADGLRRALGRLEATAGADRLDDLVLTATNLALVGRLVAGAAAMRTESRGCHRRLDIPERSDAWRLHIDTRMDSCGGLVLTRTEPGTDRHGGRDMEAA